MAEHVLGGWLVARALKREGVEVVFTLSGGHIAPIYDGCVREGIRVMDTRHEQAAVHAAEGWAKVTRRPGVALLTAGPGVTDGVTGIANAYLGGSPIIVFGGAAPVHQWDRGALQEMGSIEMIRPITKWARTIVETGRLEEYVGFAYRQATSGKHGPVFLECPMDVLSNIIPDSQVTHLQEGYRTEGKLAGDARLVERAAEVLRQAERPVIMAGTAVWWCDAAASLRAFAEHIQAPVFLNGSGRGSLPPDHPLFFSLARRTALGGADTVVLVGTKLDFRLNFGEPPLIPEDARVIWLDVAPEDIGINRGATVGIAGDVGVVMSQMVEALDKPLQHEDWLSAVRQDETKKQQADEPLLRSAQTPVHPMRLCAEIRDFIDHDTIVIGDGGDIVSFGGRVIQVAEPGHWLDAGPMGTLGAGTGYALAAQLAHPDKRVLLLYGDGAFGLNGMEFETMARHKLPVVAVIGNDGQWAQIKHPQQDALGHSTAADLAPKIRYDKMVEALGGYGEMVERPEEIRPALERAFASGKPACINVITDPTARYGRSTNAAY
jgi:acetolactate synthase-1/2/3 large subunit